MAGQPHQLDIALALPLKPPARLNAIEISVNIDLQQRGRMIRRPARCERGNAVKPELGEIQPSTNTSIARTGLSSPTYSSSTAGNKLLCWRSVPSTNRLIR